MPSQENLAVVVGASGGIGAAIHTQLIDRGGFDAVLAFARNTHPAVDITDEASIADLAAHVKALGAPRFIFDATGFLHDEATHPERALKQLTPEAMEKNFRINAMGPALLMKHFLPLFPRQGRAVFASLSAKVGSITDNKLGGWHAYRAAKAAQHQFIRGAAIELARTHPEAICVALHPGTVDTQLSAPFAKSGLKLQSPDEAALALLSVVDGLTAQNTGTLLSYTGEQLPW